MRHFIVCILALLSLWAYGQDSKEHVKVEWGVCASFNISVAGDWTTIKHGQEAQPGYGGGVGAAARILWPSNWLIEPSVVLNYEELKSTQIHDHKTDISRWSVSAPVSAGYLFTATDDLRIAPLLGVEFSYVLSNSLDSGSNRKNYKWNPLNASWGFGAEFVFDNFTVTTMGYFGLINMLSRNSFYYCKALYANKVCVSAKYYF